MATITRATWIDTTPPAVTTLTVTGLPTLASGSSATSNVIDNHTNADLDIYVNTLVRYTTTLATAFVSMFVGGSIDNTNFPDSSNDILVGTIATPVQATSYIATVNLLKAWPGALAIPAYLKLRYVNNTGTALTSGVVTYNGYALTSA